MGRTSLSYCVELHHHAMLVINLQQRVFFVVNPFALSLSLFRFLALNSVSCFNWTLPIPYVADYAKEKDWTRQKRCDRTSHPIIIIMTISTRSDLFNIHAQPLRSCVPFRIGSKQLRTKEKKRIF